MKATFEKKELNIIAKHINGFWGFPPMFHLHLEIIYVISGSINMVIDGNPRKLSAGELSITFPYSVHEYENSEDTEAIIILFPPAAVGLFEETLLSYKPGSPYISDASDLYPTFEKICKYAASKECNSQKTADAYLAAAVGEIILSLELVYGDNTSFDTTQKILTYCSEHFKEDINIKSISDALFISERAVTKIFSSKIKYSFREYINMLRITEAKSLLEKTNLKIIDIMYECGYQNQSSFNRVFYNNCGLTPKEYQDKVRRT